MLNKSFFSTYDANKVEGGVISSDTSGPLISQSYSRVTCTVPSSLPCIYQTCRTYRSKALKADGHESTYSLRKHMLLATWSFGYTRGHASTPSYVCSHDVDKHALPSRSAPLRSARGETDSISLMASCSSPRANTMYHAP